MYADDVTFQQTNAPAGSFAEKKPYFSKKHGHYGFKVEVRVLPSGHAINVTSAAPESIADIAICESNIDFHVEKLEKTSHDESMLDADPLVTEYPTAWALLADKGYQGLHRRVRAITPAKNPAGSMLSHAELVRNDKIASDRVIMENCFGRLKTLWSIASDKYAWKRENYDMFFQACVALTNVHIKCLPLREDDEHDHNRYVNRLLALGERTKDKRTNSATKSRDRRKQRLSLLLPPEDVGHYGYDSPDGSGIFD
ncbi:hypothetical protein B5M09_007608 [Aphanomyces astaci]|uniref:DDE Tnp4 domain-containing protein n=1 Tax=Aphanomyces astaci TaxID=112090 RepID=A0A3R7WLL3_APHAT|nr:hypothetical protein B5M09_007608 [Aphanomyces astaci]